MQGEVPVYPCNERNRPVLKLALYILDCAFHSLCSIKESMQTLNNLSVLEKDLKKRPSPYLYVVITFSINLLFTALKSLKT